MQIETGKMFNLGCRGKSTSLSDSFKSWADVFVHKTIKVFRIINGTAYIRVRYLFFIYNLCEINEFSCVIEILLCLKIPFV